MMIFWGCYLQAEADLQIYPDTQHRGAKELQVIQVYGFTPSTGTPFLDLDELISKQKVTCKTE